MSETSVVIIGLPSSGKTTFLAALWHIVTSREIDTALSFGGLKSGNKSHLNTIARRWREAKEQDRTAVTGNRLVSINLKDDVDNVVNVTFPDVPGESYLRMWEDRDCEPEIADILQEGNVLLFVHADNIRSPQWVVDEVAFSKALGLEITDNQSVPWHPKLSPTQVQLVDLLQLLRRPPLDVGRRRLAIMMSAWDKVRDERKSPSEYLKEKLPLLWQYLDRGADAWEFRIYGLSAQGGDYDPVEKDTNSSEEAEHLRALDCASERVQLVGTQSHTHDLTEPLKWLME